MLFPRKVEEYTLIETKGTGESYDLTYWHPATRKPFFVYDEVFDIPVMPSFYRVAIGISETFDSISGSVTQIMSSLDRVAPSEVSSGLWPYLLNISASGYLCYGEELLEDFSKACPEGSYVAPSFIYNVLSQVWNSYWNDDHSISFGTQLLVEMHDRIHGPIPKEDIEYDSFSSILNKLGGEESSPALALGRLLDGMTHADLYSLKHRVMGVNGLPHEHLVPSCNWKS